MAEVPQQRAPRCLLLAVCGALLVWLLPSAARSTPVGPRANAPLAGRPSTAEEVDAETAAHTAWGTVGLLMGKTHRHCASGFLGARNLVITCRHPLDIWLGSLERWDPTAFEIQIEGKPGEAGRRYPVLEYAYLSERYDLCVLRIGPDETGALPDANRVRTLSKQRIGLGNPIYVCHHPRGRPLEITFGGRVLFPFEALADELRIIQARLDEEPGSTAQKALRKDEVSASYLRGRDGRYRNFSRRWAGQPVIGADCMTFRGSSGAPVYDARTHALVGMLFAGVDQTRTDFESRWEHHEAILPAVKILEDLATSADPEVRALATGPRS